MPPPLPITVKPVDPVASANTSPTLVAPVEPFLPPHLRRKVAVTTPTTIVEPVDPVALANTSLASAAPFKSFSPPHLRPKVTVAKPTTITKPAERVEAVQPVASGNTPVASASSLPLLGVANSDMIAAVDHAVNKFKEARADAWEELLHSEDCLHRTTWIPIKGPTRFCEHKDGCEKVAALFCKRCGYQLCYPHKNRTTDRSSNMKHGVRIGQKVKEEEKQARGY